jgi:cyclopropane fatty-acyl-phospholipid synthase-like methyltransferase
MSTPAFSDAAATWNQRYANAEFLFGREPNEYLSAQAARLPQQGRALCVADGEGRNSVWLARQGLSVDAFDVSERALAKAATLAAEAGVTVSRTLSDCDQWPWTAETYDVVAGIFIQFADPEMRRRQFAGMVRTLKRGGLLILQGYGPKQLEYKTGGPGQLAHLYTEEILRAAFGELQILELKDYEVELSEGARHTGMSALLGLVARKP